MKGETEGIAILPQYNGHGIFIAMKELGYILINLSFFFLALAFTPENHMEKVIRIVLMIPLFLSVLFFILYSVRFGIDRDYRFEVAAITFNWLTTILVGVLFSICFYRKTKELHK